MKKIMVIVLVLAFAGMAQGALSVSPAPVTATANTNHIVGIGIQNDDGSISYLYFGNANIGRQNTSIAENIFSLFPDFTTFTGLLLIGLQARSRNLLKSAQANL